MCVCGWVHRAVNVGYRRLCIVCARTLACGRACARVLGQGGGTTRAGRSPRQTIMPQPLHPRAQCTADSRQEDNPKPHQNANPLRPLCPRNPRNSTGAPDRPHTRHVGVPAQSRWTRTPKCADGGASTPVACGDILVSASAEVLPNAPLTHVQRPPPPPPLHREPNE